MSAETVLLAESVLDCVVDDGSDMCGAPKIYLEFQTTHLRFPLDEAFVTSGGSIQGAGARGPTLMMLTGAEHSVKQHLTETPSTVRLEVPRNQWSWDGKDGVTISNRMQLNMCSELHSTPAVNVVLGESISGELVVSVASLFDREVDGKFIPASGAAVSRYSSWLNSDNTYGFRNVRFASDEGDEFSPHFSNDDEMNTRMKMAETHLQSMYDHSWKVRDAVVLKELRNLSKPITESAFGVNGSRNTPAFSVATRMFPHSINTLEDLLKAAVSTDLGDAEQIEMFCKSPRGCKAGMYAGTVVTAISLISSSLVPYRSDGAIMTMPGNQAVFKQGEAWTGHSTNSPIRQDDCEGSAATGMEVTRAIDEYAEGADSTKYPFVVASAKALVHYTPAIAILTANAGHADKVGNKVSDPAGHATLVFPKTIDLLRGLHSASTSTILTGTDVSSNVSSVGNDPAKAAVLANTRLKSLYTPRVLAKLPKEEAALIGEGWEAVSKSTMFESLPNFLVSEGTSPTASRIYTPDPTERYARAKDLEASNRVMKRFSPSVARPYRWLDSSMTGEHIFYRRFAELLLHPNTGLYNDEYLRSSRDATPHIVLTQPPANGVVSEAGATPQQLATGAYSAIPLFTIGDKDGTIFDEAMQENKLNTMRPPTGVYQANDLQTSNLSTSLRNIKNASQRIPRQSTRSDLTDATWLLSFSALAGNPSGVNVFLNDILSVEGVVGDIDIHHIRGLARNEKTGEDIGAFVALSLMVPPM
jgi:hypothetical protein